MQGAGLVTVANGTVTLDGNTIENNAGNGAEAYSTYTVNECYCPGDVESSVNVNVIGGTFQNNGQYGLMVKPGTEGQLDLSTGTPPTFISNGSGDYLLDTGAIPMCSDCGCDKEEPESKPYNTIGIPFSGSGNIPQNCSIYAGTVMQLPDGTFVKVGCPFEGYSNLQGVTQSDLPGLLGAGNTFELGILLGLYGTDGTYILNSDGSITLSFKIPENSSGRSHRLLYWDSTLNDGAGGWYELPKFEFGTSFPLHPDDPNDLRLIVSGVQQNGSTLLVTVNFGGTFIMVAN